MPLGQGASTGGRWQSGFTKSALPLSPTAAVSRFMEGTLLPGPYRHSPYLCRARLMFAFAAGVEQLSGKVQPGVGLGRAGCGAGCWHG